CDLLPDVAGVDLRRSASAWDADRRLKPLGARPATRHGLAQRLAAQQKPSITPGGDHALGHLLRRRGCPTAWPPGAIEGRWANRGQQARVGTAFAIGNSIPAACQDPYNARAGRSATDAGQEGAAASKGCRTVDGPGAQVKSMATGSRAAGRSRWGRGGRDR